MTVPAGLARPSRPEPISRDMQTGKSEARKRPRRFFVHIERDAAVQTARQELPVCMHEQEIIEAIHSHDVVLITGATGTGKTTQLPQFLLEDGFGDPNAPYSRGVIAVTQPRRVAAVACAKRVAHEVNGRVGGLVGYQIRHEANVGPDTKVRFVTDGVLLREVEEDVLLRKYSAVVVDEAHERSMNTDLLLSFLSRSVVMRRQKADLGLGPLKVIIMSATLEIDGVFSGEGALFPDAPVVKVPSRQYPVITHFARRTEDNYVQAAFEKTAKIHRRLPQGGVLVFVSGRQEVEELCTRLREEFGSRKIKIKDSDGPAITMKVLPFYALLPDNLQRMIFDDFGDEVRKVVIATNIAETSVTVPGVSYVVDSGRVKEKIYRGSGTRLLSSYEVVWVSQASAEQRAGRAGRTGPGHCYRLYSSAVYDQQFKPFREPEIRRVPADAIVLRLRAMGIRYVHKFPFPTKPDEDDVAAAESLLTDLGALCTAERVSSLEGDIRGRGQAAESTILGVTNIGRDLAKLPLPPRFGRMLLTARAHPETLPYVCRIAAILTVGTVLDRTTPNWRELHRVISHPRSDLMTELAAVCAVEHAGNSGLSPATERRKKRNDAAMRQVCVAHSLHFKSIIEALAITEQLEDLFVQRAAFSKPLRPPDRKVEKEILGAFLSGFPDRVARRMTRHEAAGLGVIPRRQKLAFVTPAADGAVFLESCSSVRLDGDVEFVAFSDLVISHAQTKHIKDTKGTEDDYIESDDEIPAKPSTPDEKPNANPTEAPVKRTTPERVAMRGATVVSRAWLLEHATAQCRFARPTSQSPPPRYDPCRDYVTQQTSASYGTTWPLGTVDVPVAKLRALHGDDAIPSDVEFRAFGAALAAGAVRKDLRLDGVGCEPAARVVAMACASVGVASAAALRECVVRCGEAWLAAPLAALGGVRVRRDNGRRWRAAVAAMRGEVREALSVERGVEDGLEGGGSEGEDG